MFQSHLKELAVLQVKYTDIDNETWYLAPFY